MDKKTVFAHIDNNTGLAVELETLLSSIPAIAPESGGEGEGKKADALIPWLKAHGITDIQRYDAPDSRVPSGKRPNVVATIPGAKHEKRLWLMAHLDVVPPGEAKLWNTDPWKVVVKDGVLYGRGVEDDQQGLVSSVLAALALKETGAALPYDLKLLFVADEEVGSDYGIKYLLAHHADLFHTDDFVVIPDGGDAKGETIEVAEKNLLWLKVTTKGQQCHGSRPDQGHNAFLAGADLALRLHDLQNHFNARDPLFEPDYSTFSPTKKDANVPNINTIPGEDVFYVDMRILPRYPLDLVRKEIRARADAVERQYGVKVFFEEPQAVESKATAADSPAVKELQKAVKELRGFEPHPIGIGGGTVGAFLRNIGVASVVWGTLDESAHQPNEYAKMANILADAKVISLLAMRGN